MNKQQLAARIWASANKMRSKIEASEYKDYILGFIFYKYLSDKEEAFMLRDGGMTQDELVQLQEQDNEIVRFCQTNIGYFIAYDNLFSTWLKMGNDFSVQNVTIALSAFERLINEDYKKLFEKIFSALSSGIDKLGSTAAQQSKAILDLLSLIKDIPTDDRQGYDVLGFIYEYLIGQFAANAGKKAGEFYTPHEVSVLMSEIVAGYLHDRKTISIYDPTSGSGSLLLNIGRAISKHTNNKDSVHYFAQELKSATFNLTRMNLVMRGIKPSNIEVRNADTLEQDWPKDERTNAPTLYLDAVVSNPPYSQPWSPAGKELDPRYRYGVAPKGKADYAFLLHDLYHLKPDGIMTIVLPHGVLFRGDPAKEEAEGVIRKNLIENNHIDAIIGLPADIFFGTGIATIIMVLRQKRDRDDVLFIDASKGFIKSGKKNKLRASDIRRIVDTYESRRDADKYARRVSREEIRANGYNLNIPRYVDSSDAAETWDLYATMYGAIPNREIDALPYWKHLPTLRDSLFQPISSTHSTPRKDDEIRYLINADRSYCNLRNDYTRTMDGIDAFLHQQLLSSINTVPVNREEDIISDELFARLGKHPIFNPYDVYQLLDDSWQVIATDLEILQSEGWDKVREVEPNMVLKKKKDKDFGVETEIEVQEGWRGRIMPFELVQELFLRDMLDHRANLQAEAEGCANEIDDKIRELTDENREKYIDAESEKLDTKQLAADVKAMQKDPDLKDPELMELQRLLNKQKEINKELKALEAALIDKTCYTIEHLTDDDAYTLLREKWVMPLCAKIHSLPTELLNTIETDVNRLIKRYADTLLNVGNEIEKAESELAKLLGELTGDEADMQAIREMSTLNKGLAIAEKLFPQKGSKVPAIRFKGFEGEWEEMVAGDIFTTFDERNHPELPVLAATQDKGMVIRDEIGYNIAHNRSNEVTYKRVLPGQYVIHLRSFQGGFAHSNVEGITSPAYDVFGFKNPEKHDDYFWKYIFSSAVFIKRLVKVTYGIRDGRNVSYAEFLQLPFIIPSKSEQTKIAKFFIILSNLITLRERQLTLLKHSKQALLEQMFVNE